MKYPHTYYGFNGFIVTGENYVVISSFKGLRFFYNTEILSTIEPYELAPLF